jgi:hypothetical protein
MRCFGFGLLNFRMWSSKSAKGVSLKTLELYALTFLVRLLSIMRHQGYLPFDKSGDWFYHTVSRRCSQQQYRLLTSWNNADLLWKYFLIAILATHLLSNIEPVLMALSPFSLRDITDRGRQFILCYFRNLRSHGSININI